MVKASREKEQPSKQAPSPEIAGLPHRLTPTDLLTRPLAVFLLIAVIAILIYSNTFSASFHFDDNTNIVVNPRIKDLSNFWDLSGTRYVGFLSFALNYHFGGLSVFGYHLINLIIHIVNGFLVYWLVLLLFKAVQGSPSLPTAPWIALATALLFIAHPIQTQAVTYIVQRFASLAALFYLLAVVCYLSWRLTPSENKSRHLWYAGALISTIVAMKTKENSFTLPFMILLVDWIFFRSFTRMRWLTLTPFLLALLIIPLSHVDAGGTKVGSIQQTTEISRFDYLFTQFRVIVTYIRLLFLPVNQNVDYDYPIYHSLFEPPVFFSFLFLSSLFALSVHLLFNLKIKNPNSRLIAFGLLWFFLTISIESSIIPIRDVIFEHRLYLPSAGFFLSVVIAATLLFSRFSFLVSRPKRGLAAYAMILLFFSAATYQRNLAWKDDTSLWKDVVQKSPNKARGHNNLGEVFAAQGRLREAVNEYQTAIQVRSDYALAHYNLGSTFAEQGRLIDALQEYQAALNMQPDFAEVHNNLGSVIAEQGHMVEAIREFQTALELKPTLVEGYYNLGNAYLRMGQLHEAINAFKQALQIKPDFLAARQALESLSK